MKKIKKLVLTMVHMNYVNRTYLFSSVTVIVNGLIGIGKIFLGIVMLSDWQVANGLYYLSLSCGKGYILKATQQVAEITTEEQHPAKRKLAERSGIFMCVIGVSYFGVSLHTLLTKKVAYYPQNLLWVISVITVFKIIFGMYGIVITRKNRSLEAFLLKMLDVIDAMVSIVEVRGLYKIMAQDKYAVESNGIFGLLCSATFIGIGLFTYLYHRFKDNL